MKSETLSKALDRPVNLNHERIDDIVIELIEKLDKQTDILKFYGNKDNYEPWEEYEDATGFFHNVDFDRGAYARKVLGIGEYENGK